MTHTEHRECMAATGDILLASDLDGTLLPPAMTQEREEELQSFRDEVAAARTLRIAYVTGRHLPHALDAMEAFALPRPDYLGCEVGAALYVRKGAEYREVEAYRALMETAMNVDGDRVRACLDGVAGLTRQTEEHQGDFKASFHLPWPPPDDLVDEIRQRLAAAGARTTVVLSRGGDGGGLLDVLPEGGAKDRAVRYIVDELGVSRRRALFAGDSGNDRAALLMDIPGVLVANASRDLADELQVEARRRGTSDCLHLATRPYAAGVLEGMRHFGLAHDLGYSKSSTGLPDGSSRRI